MNVRLAGGDRIAKTPAAASGLDIASGRVRLYSLVGFNSGPDQYIHLYDAVAVPADTTVPDAVLAVFQDREFYFDFPQGELFELGVAVSNSTTNLTKTAGAADCLFRVSYRYE